MEKQRAALVVTAGVITTIAPFGLFLVLALLIPHPFPGVVEAGTRVLLAAVCITVIIGAVVITWKNRKTIGLARLMFRVTTVIFVVAAIGTAASWFLIPGLITAFGAVAFFTLPIWILSLLNRLFVRANNTARQ